jgi:conjugal transfer pilus assembly protein TraI
MARWTWGKKRGQAKDGAARDPSEEIPRYPPFERGLPVTPVDEVVATQHELIVRLDETIGCTRELFQDLILPVIHRYAELVHLLPASQMHHHRGAGGLFRHGLEVAVHAANATRAMVFAMDRTPGERLEIEPRWRVAAALAGVCHDLGKPVSDLSISDRDGTLTWRPMKESIPQWAGSNGIERYFLHWRREREHNAHQLIGMMVLDRVLTAEIKNWLSEYGDDILRSLLATVGGLEKESTLGRLTTEADCASVDRDLRENRLDLEALSLGVPVERYLIDAMRRLIRSGRWRINIPGARLWMFEEGLHVVWPLGGREIAEIFNTDRAPGIPRDPDTLADLLIEHGHAVPCRRDGYTTRYWRLAPGPLAAEGERVELTMVRMVQPETILVSAVPKPVALAAADEDVHRAPRRTANEEEAAPLPGSEEQGRPGTAPRFPRSPQRPPQEQAVVLLEPVQQGTAPSAPQVPPVLQQPVASRPLCERDMREPAGEASDAEACTVAREWLRAHGPGGEVLIEVADAIAAGEIVPGVVSTFRTQHIILAFPDAFAGAEIAAPKRVETVGKADMITIDPKTPLLRVRTINGGHWVVLTPEASAHFKLLLGTGADAAVHPAVTLEEASTPQAQRPSAIAPTNLSPAQAAAHLVQVLRADESPATAQGNDASLHLEHAQVLTWAQQLNVKPAALLRALQRVPGCRVTAQGGLLFASDRERRP